MRFRNGLTRFLRDSFGGDLIEYALLASFVAVLLTAGGTGLGTNVNAWYARMASFVAGATADDTSGGSSSPIGYEGPGGSQASGNGNDGNGNGDGGNSGGK